ncbi:MAG: CBS domain-containing protein [Chloroflexota bacterium]|nr:CBS domain-containing protein [Chloroflexota bacterium]
MKAADIMRQPVLATTPAAWVQEVLAYLATHDISGMPVVERDGTVIGMVTADDILRAFVNGLELRSLTVREIMSRDPITVDVETPVVEVIQVLHDEGILRVPVLENNRLVGIISRSDVIKALVPLEGLEDPGFLVFHRRYPSVTFEDSRAAAEETAVPTHGW